MDFEEACNDFIANKREVRKYNIEDYFIIMVRNERSAEIHKHREGFKPVLNRDFENDYELIMLIFENGFYELFSFGTTAASVCLGMIPAIRYPSQTQK